MGNNIDKKLKHNEEIHQHSSEDEVSPFYFACRNGDLENVKLMLSTMSYKELNRLEPNGSTPLHAASFYGHIDIVHLLLHERGCDRSQRDSSGLTAYEVAKSDEIRKLFYRPLNNNRFCINNEQEHNIIQPTISIASSSIEQIKDNNNDDELIHSKWIKLYQTEDEINKEIRYLGKGKRLIQSRLGRFIGTIGAKYYGDKDLKDVENLLGYLTDRTYRAKKIREIIDTVIPKEHSQYDKCCHLLFEYLHDGNVESLLKLYSLETPFYHALSNDIGPLKWPLLLNLPTLKHRYFQGQCFRGILMTNDDLHSYYSALKNKGSFIRTNTFSSASIDRNVAECFGQLSFSYNDKQSVLMHYYFPKSCDQAINLGHIKKSNLQCISEYEDESEVLILPRTLFIVKDIFQINIIDDNQKQKQYTEIYLENVLHGRESLLSSLQFLISKTEQNEMALYYNSLQQAEAGHSNQTTTTN